MDAIVKFLRPIFSRIVGAWVAALAVWLAAHFHIILDETAQEQVISGFIVLLIALVQTIYAMIHRAIDVHFNPKDIASPTLAEKTK
jgi:hypothetical protein